MEDAPHSPGWLLGAPSGPTPRVDTGLASQKGVIGPAKASIRINPRMAQGKHRNFLREDGSWLHLFALSLEGEPA